MTLKSMFFTGGGARCAYQAGVLKGIQEVLNPDSFPVEMLGGVSAGSINSAFLAGHAENYAMAADKLVDIWSNLHCGKVFEASNLSLCRSVSSTLWSIISHHRDKDGGYLLDSSPLKDLLTSNIDFDTLNQNICNGVIQSLDVTALNYNSADTVSFVNTCKPHTPRKKFRYCTTETDISADHIMASSAIPIFFPSININGMHYGDGSFRNNHPLRTNIALGAEKIVLISVTHHKESTHKTKGDYRSGVSFGKILSMGFNSIFLDNIELDVELMTRINQGFESMRGKDKSKEFFRPVQLLYLRPSRDLGRLAVSKISRLPGLLKYLLGGFGSKKQSSDMLSYLLFEAEYCKRLIELGYEDALYQKDRIQQFFED